MCYDVVDVDVVKCSYFIQAGGLSQKFGNAEIPILSERRREKKMCDMQSAASESTQDACINCVVA